MHQEIELNVCGLPPCEPMEHVLLALSTLAPENRLAVLLDREPLPLFRILDSWGMRHCHVPRLDGLYELLIWRMH